MAFSKIASLFSDLTEKDNQNKANPFANTRNQKSAPAVKAEKESQYRKIDSYRPSGGLIYNNEILKKIETKLNRDWDFREKIIKNFLIILLF